MDNGSNGAGPSHLDWIRERHEALSAERFLDREVPGYQGRLVVRYGRPPWSVMARAQAALAKPDRDGAALLATQLDFLVAACREVLVRDDGQLKPIDPSGETRRFDPELADLLHAGTASARDLVRWLFNYDPVVAVEAGEVVSWALDQDADVADELMGESAPVVK